MLRRNNLERRLFAWMLVLALVPALGLVAVGIWLWGGSLEWIGTLGPWDRVAASGQRLFEAAAGAAARDTVLAAALERHRSELSSSVVLAHRWAFLGERLGSMVPALGLALALVLAGAALATSRRLARELARPIRELVAWAGRLGREEALPERQASELREVTEVRVLREAFRRAAADLTVARARALDAERVRVWGEMARRVAHEMKNPLTPLRLAGHRLARSSGGDPTLAEPLAVIGEEVARLEELARQFALLGRPPDGPTSAIDAAELLASLLETDVPPAVGASLEVAGDVPLVEGHYEALVRAFRNLIRNGVEAMEGLEGPRHLVVRVGALPAPGAADWIEVRIADGGPGLPAHAGNRIFEPDFTTKSRGTGLGLALARQAVAAHGGTIEAADRPGGGAEFVVRIPAMVPAAVAAR